jgi:hypothetical protein
MFTSVIFMLPSMILEFQKLAGTTRMDDLLVVPAIEIGRVITTCDLNT